MTSPQLTADDELDAIVRNLHQERYGNLRRDGATQGEAYELKEREIAEAKAAIISWADKRALRIANEARPEDWTNHANRICLKDICVCGLAEYNLALEQYATAIKSRLEKR